MKNHRDQLRRRKFTIGIAGIKKLGMTPVGRGIVGYGHHTKLNNENGFARRKFIDYIRLSFSDIHRKITSQGSKPLYKYYRLRPFEMQSGKF